MVVTCGYRGLRTDIEANAESFFCERLFPFSPLLPWTTSGSGTNSILSKIIGYVLLSIMSKRPQCDVALDGATESPQECSLGELLRTVLPDDFADVPLATQRYSVQIHGVEVPPETPLVWLARTVCNPDLFVHIVVRPRSN